MALYDAFVSYSHAKDKPIAAALQSVVQKLGKPWYRRRALRVFRDDTSLSATPHLWPAIEQALSQSRYFILLASPEAAASKWVNKEVAFWLEHSSVDTLLIGVTDGELSWDEEPGDFGRRENMPLPPVLTGRFPVEPKWVDLRAYRDGADPRNAKFIELGADFAAAIRGMPKEDLLSQEVRQQRRALTLAWSGTGTLAVLMALAGWQWLEAERAMETAIAERDNATRNFNLARQTADSLVVDVARGLRNVQGMNGESVRKILETARATFEQLAASAPDDLELQRSRSVMLDEFGDAYLTLGDVEQGLKSYRDSLAIAERLRAADPNIMRQIDLTVSYNRVGDALKLQGKLEEALKVYRRGLDLAGGLADADPDNTDWQRHLPISYDRIGDVLLAQGSLDDALKAYRDGLAIRERLGAIDPSNTLLQRDLSASYEKVGDVLKAQGKLADPLKSNRDCVVKNSGVVVCAGSKLDDALKSYRDNLAIAERLAAADPNDTQLQRDLSVAYERIGDVLDDQGELDDAVKAYGDGLAITERLTAADRSNMEWQHDLAVIHWNLAMVYLRRGNVAEALTRLRKSRDIMAAVVAVASGYAQWKRDLASFDGEIARIEGQAQEAAK